MSKNKPEIETRVLRGKELQQIEDMLGAVLVVHSKNWTQLRVEFFDTLKDAENEAKEELLDDPETRVAVYRPCRLYTT